MVWDRPEILAEIKRRGETLSSLERRYKIPLNTLSVALCRPYPKAEKVISRFLKVKANILFAYRDGTPSPKQPDVSRVAPNGESQKCIPVSDMEAVA